MRLSAKGRSALASVLSTLFLAGASVPAVLAAGVGVTDVQTVTVVMAEYSFAPAHLEFRRGVAYRLHLENRGAELHEFTAPDFFKAVEVKNPDALASGGQDVVVNAREQKDVLFVPQRPGRYDLRCADHDFQGMTGDIVIE